MHVLLKINVHFVRYEWGQLLTAKKTFLDQSFYERKMRLRQLSKSLITSFWSKLHFDGEKHDAVPKLPLGSRNRYLQVFSKSFYRDFP